MHLRFLKPSCLPLLIISFSLNYNLITFPNFTSIFIDGSISSLSTGYDFYIPDLHISKFSNIPPSSFTYTAKCFTILKAFYQFTLENVLCFPLSNLKCLSFNFLNFLSSSISNMLRHSHGLL